MEGTDPTAPGTPARRNLKYDQLYPFILYLNGQFNTCTDENSRF